MVNKLQGNYANLNALLAQSVNNSNQTSMPTGLQSRAHLAPSTAAQTKQQEFVDIRLGPRVLRTETAALTVLSALQLQFGDLAN